MSRLPIFAATAALVLLAQPARACMGDLADEALIHSALPAQVPPGVLVLRVDITGTDETQLYQHGLEARVTQVVEGQFADKAALLRLPIQSDCDRPFANGHKGILVGMVRERDDGVAVIEPYAVSRSSGFRLTARNAISPEWLGPPQERIRKWFATHKAVFDQ